MCARPAASPGASVLLPSPAGVRGNAPARMDHGGSGMDSCSSDASIQLTAPWPPVDAVALSAATCTWAAAPAGVSEVRVTVAASRLSGPVPTLYPSATATRPVPSPGSRGQARPLFFATWPVRRLTRGQAGREPHAGQRHAVQVADCAAGGAGSRVRGWEVRGSVRGEAGEGDRGASRGSCRGLPCCRRG